MTNGTESARNACGINPNDNMIYCTTRDLRPSSVREQLVRIKCDFPPGWTPADGPVVGETCYLGKTSRSLAFSQWSSPSFARGGGPQRKYLGFMIGRASTTMIFPGDPPNGCFLIFSPLWGPPKLPSWGISSSHDTQKNCLNDILLRYLHGVFHKVLQKFFFPFFSVFLKCFASKSP